MTLEQYISSHEQIRTRVIAARYPEISDPKTTVEFLIDGLRFNPSTAIIGSHLIALDPKDTKDFVHKFNRLTMYRQPTQLPPSHMHGDAGGSNSIKTSAPAPYWYNRTPRRNLPVPKNPYRFHMSLGVSRLRHTDLESNHTAHSRHLARPQSLSKPQNTARTAHGHFDYTGDTGMAMDDTASEDPLDDNCTYIFDSGAHPSHITNLSTIHQPKQTSHKTKTATNQIVQCTHTGQTTIKTNKGHTLMVAAFVSPDIISNLLSVRSITQTQGTILFTPHTAYLFDKHARRKIIGTAPWNPAIKAYAWKATPHLQARGARTISAPRRTRQPHKPQPPPANPHPPTHSSSQVEHHPPSTHNDHHIHLYPYAQRQHHTSH